MGDAADQVSLAVFVGTGMAIAWLNHRLQKAEASQRTAAATAIARAERLDAILNTTVDGIIVIDAKGTIEAFNRGAQELFGYPEAEVVGRNVSMLMPSPHHEEHDQYLARYLATGAAKIIGVGREVPGRKRDGSVFPVHLSVGEMRIGGERKFTGMLHDLTRRARLEGELGASEARWRAVVDSAVDAIIVIDAHGRVEAFNPAAERLFGYSAAEVCGQNVDMLMPSPYREEHDSYLSRYLATGRAKIIGKGREVQGRRKDGTTFPLHLSVGQMTMQGERKFTGILHDLTDRVQMEARLTEQASLAKLGEMAAVVAHEVKNPLAGIRGAVQVFASRLSDDASTPILREIIARIDALDQMMKDLLLFARPPQPKYSPTDVVPLVISITSMMRQDPVASGVDFDIAGAAPPIPRGRRDAPDRLPESPDQWRARDAGKGQASGRGGGCRLDLRDRVQRRRPRYPAGDSREDLHTVLHDEIAWLRSWSADRETAGGGPPGSADHRLPARRAAPRWWFDFRPPAADPRSSTLDHAVGIPS